AGRKPDADRAHVAAREGGRILRPVCAVGQGNGLRRATYDRHRHQPHRAAAPGDDRDLRSSGRRGGADDAGARARARGLSYQANLTAVPDTVTISMLSPITSTSRAMPITASAPMSSASSFISAMARARALRSSF